MKLSVLFSDRSITLNGEAYRNDELVLREDPNHRVIQWDDRNSNGVDKDGNELPTGNGWIEVYQDDKIWLTDRATVQKWVDLHAEIKAIHEAEVEAANAARKEQNRAIMAGELDIDEDGNVTPRDNSVAPEAGTGVEDTPPSSE